MSKGQEPDMTPPRGQAAVGDTPDRRPRCIWCGKNRKPSQWEQNKLDGEWARLCEVCARSRLNNPWNALLPMRKIEVLDDV